MSVIHLDIGEGAENLELVDVSNFTMTWPKFYHMISRSSKLRKLRLWDVVFDDGEEVLDLETILACFPLLSHLSLCYDLKDGGDQFGLNTSFQFENLNKLELGWTFISEVFSEWVERLVERCSNLEKLVIFGVVSEAKNHEECLVLANFTSSIVRLIRKYMYVDIPFEFE